MTIASVGSLVRDRLAATLNADQLALLSQVEPGIEAGAYQRALEEAKQEFNEVCRHLPGLAAGLRGLMLHVPDEQPDERGRCCTG